MEDLSLHIMDIVENSIRANSKNIDVRLIEDKDNNTLTLEIEDDGIGMDEKTKEKAASPFFTTKGKRRFGLGLSLLAQSAEEAGGGMSIETKIGRGTKVAARFNMKNIDIRPIGDIDKTMKCLETTHPEINFSFRHIVKGRGKG